MSLLGLPLRLSHSAPPTQSAEFGGVRRAVCQAEGGKSRFEKKKKHLEAEKKAAKKAAKAEMKAAAKGADLGQNKMNASFATDATDAS